MNRIATAVMLSFVMLTSASLAKTFSIPDGKPVASFTIPDAWDPNEYDAGVEATSEDGNFYIAFETLDKKDSKEATRAAMLWFAAQGVTLDPQSMTSDEILFSGAPALAVSFKGRDEDGPTNVRMLIVATNKDERFLMIYAWGSDQADKANGKVIDQILGSVKLTK